jgi:hypothetical protein
VPTGGRQSARPGTQKRREEEKKREEGQDPPLETRKKTPDLDRVGLDGWTGRAALALFPACPAGDRSAARFNPEDSSWFVVCGAEAPCRWKVDPRKEGRRRGAQADAEQARRAHARPTALAAERKNAHVYRYPGPTAPAPVGALIAAALPAEEPDRE